MAQQLLHQVEHCSNAPEQSRVGVAERELLEGLLPFRLAALDECVFLPPGLASDHDAVGLRSATRAISQGFNRTAVPLAKGPLVIKSIPLPYRYRKVFRFLQICP